MATPKNIPPEVLSDILKAQKHEYSAHKLYKRLENSCQDKHNSHILKSITKQQYAYYTFWKSITHKSVQENVLATHLRYITATLFGLTFGIKLMQRSEKETNNLYKQLSPYVPQTKRLLKDKLALEKKQVKLINEDRLYYLSSIVLGLNDALVELTGALVGLTFAFQNSLLIGIAGLITGIAATFAMTASEYLSTQAEISDKNAIKAGLFTGGSYFLTVIALVAPFFFLTNPFAALSLSLMAAVFVIFAFTYYSSVVLGTRFWKRFIEMILLSLGVAAITFVIGLLIRNYFQIEI